MKWNKLIDLYEKERIAKYEAPRKGMNNSAISNSAIQFYKEEKFKGQPFKSYVESTEWYVERNVHKGIIRRYASAAVFIKLDEKVCQYTIISVEQKYNSGSYGKSFYGGVGKTSKVLCSKIK